MPTAIKYNGKKRWSFSDHEKKYVDENQGSVTVREMARVMGRTVSQVNGYIQNKKRLTRLNSREEYFETERMRCWITGEKSN